MVMNVSPVSRPLLSDRQWRWFRSVARATWLLCIGVVILGAYVRLSDAGLGCPDWPGCYGHVGVPQAAEEVARANAAFPERPVEIDKAWKEMIHRYFASGVGLGILVLLIMGWKTAPVSRGFLLGLFGLVCFQGILGMWTVTWQLKPAVVTAHLLGGMTTLALLTWLNVQVGRARHMPGGHDDPSASTSAMVRSRPPASKGLRRFAVLAFVVLGMQIFLGGWTSTNYAALACTDFPTCHQEWWPEADFDEAFVIWRGLGVNYEFGVLDSPARTAIHLSHRIGFLVVTAVFLALSVLLWRERRQGWAVALLMALAAQIVIGISTVLYSLPLWLATAHNAGAAVLVMLMTALNARLRMPHNG